MKPDKIIEEIKNVLIMLKKQGAHIDQYDTKLFDLFIIAYKNHYMDFNCSPRLTADGIRDQLNTDNHYNGIKDTTSYGVDAQFYEKWSHWTEAFKKGFQGGHIVWKP